MFDRHLRKLADREKNGEFRFLSSNSSEIDFFSNDYLGFAKVNFTSKSNFGSTGSRLLSGNSKTAERCENRISEFFQSESAMCFGSGYLANVALLSTLPLRGDTILYDELIHASLRDGIRLSFANSMSYRHNDVVDLEKKLALATGQVYIVTEGLFSMDGDICSLPSISILAKKFKACLILDEAHSVGVFGKEGRGLVHGMDLLDMVDIRIVTFGKAFGYHGAAILSSTLIKKILINFARPFIYTTAPSEDFFERILFLLNESKIRTAQVQLHKNIDWFRKNILVKNNAEPNSPIQTIFGNREKLSAQITRLKEFGIYQKPILSPTVSKGNERIRICIHSFNKISELNVLKSALNL